MEERGGEGGGVEEEGTGGGVEEGGRVRLLLQLQLLLAELQATVLLPLPEALLVLSSTSLGTPSINTSVSFSWL